jgi:hypothetical protein
MPAVGQTKQQVEAVWGKPDRTRLNSDGTRAYLFVSDKWKFAAPFYGMAARMHALVIKFGPDSRLPRVSSTTRTGCHRFKEGGSFPLNRRGASIPFGLRSNLILCMSKA